MLIPVYMPSIHIKPSIININFLWKLCSKLCLVVGRTYCKWISKTWHGNDVRSRICTPITTILLVPVLTLWLQKSILSMLVGLVGSFHTFKGGYLMLLWDQNKTELCIKKVTATWNHTRARMSCIWKLYKLYNQCQLLIIICFKYCWNIPIHFEMKPGNIIMESLNYSTTKEVYMPHV